MTAISNAPPRDFATAVDADFERERLRLLGTLLNPMTTRRLDQLGVGRGWRCLEIGAGDGSFLRVRPLGGGGRLGAARQARS